MTWAELERKMYIENDPKYKLMEFLEENKEEILQDVIEMEVDSAWDRGYYQGVEDTRNDG